MRQHLEHLAAALGALALALFISYFNTGAHAVTLKNLAAPHPSLVAVGSGAPAISPTAFFSTSTVPALFPTQNTQPAPATATAAPSIKTPITPKEPTTAPSAPAIPTPAPAVPAPSIAPPAQATTTVPVTNDTPLLESIAPSVVNILCASGIPGFHSISGSGVIVSSNGVIITVAHVAQMVLLQEYLGRTKVACEARIGNPARAAYLIRPIYVSSAWVHANSTTLISSQPTGTGENDIALLGITGGVNGAALPASFPFQPVSFAIGSVGQTIGIGSYGAQDLSTAQVVNDLMPTLAMSAIKAQYTLGGNTVDVLSIGGTIASQEGSSGGGIFDTNGNLIGVITTSDVSGDVSSRELRAITTSYIQRALEAASGGGLDSYLNGNAVNAMVASYAPTAQTLGQFLAQALNLQS